MALLSHVTAENCSINSYNYSELISSLYLVTLTGELSKEKLSLFAQVLKSFPSFANFEDY